MQAGEGLEASVSALGQGLRAREEARGPEAAAPTREGASALLLPPGRTGAGPLRTACKSLGSCGRETPSPQILNHTLLLAPARPLTPERGAGTEWGGRSSSPASEEAPGASSQTKVSTVWGGWGAPLPQSP